MRRHGTIRELIEGQRLLTSAPSATVREAARAMAERGVGALPVVDKGRLIGIFTERDALTRVLAEGLDPEATRLADVMTREPDTITPGEAVAEAIRRMDELGYRHLPVVEAEHLVGIVSLRDFAIGDLAAMADELEMRRDFVERGR